MARRKAPRGGLWGALRAPHPKLLKEIAYNHSTMNYEVKLDTNFGDVVCRSKLTAEQAGLLRRNIGKGEVYMKEHYCEGCDPCVFCAIHPIISSVIPTEIGTEMNSGFIDDMLITINDGEDDFVK